ncbi:MAG TPA: LLM class flavin-dependent oxidoreductase [Vicinamibacterales bacterium]|nr:LLM class flavin-dependent oxidoreductase [Vicinamibacterales bacterium]
MPSPGSTTSLKLSVLDQSPISQGMSTGDALRNSIDLAQAADRLGYTRYWVAEHHASRMLACSSPEALLGPIGAATTGIRLGSGGIMLPHYSALKVAETFRMLGALYPDRVDLGLGRAPGSDPLTAWALQRDKRQAAPDDFPDQLAELLAYIRDGLPPQHRLARVAELPPPEERPTPWLLGSSPQSGVWAAELGLPYAFADFIAPGGAAIARRYAQTFRPSSNLAAPRTIVAAWALCAESAAEAERLAASSRMAFAHFLSGNLIPVPPVHDALAFLEANRDLLDTIVNRRRAIVGAPASVRGQLEELAAEYGAEEVMIVTITYDHAARRRSYELLAAEFGLSPRVSGR